MSMKPYRLKPCTQGDIGDERLIQLTGVESLAGVSTVVANLWYREEEATLTGSVYDEDTNTILLSLGVGAGWLPSDPTPGAWRGQLVLTWTTGDRLTWPAASHLRPEYFEIIVQDRGDD